MIMLQNNETEKQVYSSEHIIKIKKNKRENLLI